MYLINTCQSRNNQKGPPLKSIWCNVYFLW